MLATVTKLRPGREPPAPPPPIAPATGNVVLSRDLRDALLAINAINHRLQRIASGPSAPATAVATVPSLTMEMVDAISRLVAAHEDQGRVG